MKVSWLLLMLLLGVVALVHTDRDDFDDDDDDDDDDRYEHYYHDDDDAHYPRRRPTSNFQWSHGRPPTRRIPHVIFHDEHDWNDWVDMGDIFDNDFDTGEMMVAIPTNGTITLHDVNRAVAACRRNWCPRYKACLLTPAGAALCECPTPAVCDGLEDQTLCASNGQTYTNRCMLRVDECAGSQLIRVFYRGQCRDRSQRRWWS